MRLKTTFLLMIILLIISSGCVDVHQNSIVGKKLYVLAGGRHGSSTELELYFENDLKVRLKLTCIYLPTGVDLSSSKEKSFLKQVVSSIDGNYSYTFNNDTLTIPNTAFVNRKLNHNDGFYTDSNGQLYNNKSILHIPKSEKVERLQKINNGNVIDVERELLPNEITFDDLIR